MSQQPMNFEVLSNLVLKWAYDKGIAYEDPHQAVVQIGKMKEEVSELEAALEQVAFAHKSGDNFELSDAAFEASQLELGDVLVTVIITAVCAGLDPVHSLQKAYEKISKRTGQTINGVFIKDENRN